MEKNYIHARYCQPEKGPPNRPVHLYTSPYFTNAKFIGTGSHNIHYNFSIPVVNIVLKIKFKLVSLYNLKDEIIQNSLIND